MDTETKTLSLSLKADGDAGDFVATFATFNVMDHDGDVTRPGAFTDGKEVLVGAYQHAMSSLPTGRGVIQSDADAAQIHGSFFLDTPHGAATYQTVKAAGELMEWSYIYRVERSSEGDFDTGGTTIPDVRFLEAVDVWSVDPVLKGAGIGTGTDNIKSIARPYARHADDLIAEVEAFISRTDARIELRAKDGRGLSADDRDRLTALLAGLEDAKSRWVDALKGQATAGIPDVEQAYLEFVALSAEFQRVA